MREIILEKRYPYSREEDITDAFMRGYEIGREREHRWWSAFCANCMDEQNSSEKPNNCDTCKYGEDKHRYAHICNECGVGINNYEPKDEPHTELVNDSPILVKDLVDDEFNPYDEECMRCKHLKLKCEFIPTYCKFESRDEPTPPQTDCQWK